MVNLDELRQENTFTLGVRSAWRKTVTLALSSHVKDSCVGTSAVGSGLSRDDESRIHSAARISAALSRVNYNC